MAPAGVAAPQSRNPVEGEDCLSEASSAALTIGTGVKAPGGPRPGANGFGSFCRNKRTSACGDETPHSELPDPAHFHEVAFEVEQLRVGFAHLVGKRDLGAEPEHRDRAVQQRGPQDAGLVLASRVIDHERRPLALVIRPPELAAEAHGKAPRQRHIRPHPRPVPGIGPGVHLGLLLLIAHQQVDLHDREGHVGGAQGEHHERPFQKLLLLVFAVAPQGPPAQPQTREDPVLHFQAHAVIVVEAVLTEPALAHGCQQAHLRIPVDQPARPHEDPGVRLVELLPFIFPVVEVETRAQAPALGQGKLVFAAAPAHHADIGTGHALCTPAERQAVDIDELRIRRGVDIGVRGQGEPEVSNPAAPGPHDIQKPVDVPDQDLRRPAHQGPFEMVAGQRVFFLQIEGQGQFQTYAHQSGPADQDGPERRDGLVQEREPCFLLDSGRLGPPAGGQAQEKPHVRQIAVVRGQGTQDLQ